MLLIISLGLLGLSGYIVFEKQNKKYTHQSFQLNKTVKTLFFPDVDILMDNQLSELNFNDIELPNEAKKVMAELKEKDQLKYFESLMIKFDSISYLISLSLLNNETDFENNLGQNLNILSKRTGDFCIITNVRKHTVNKNAVEIDLRGNFDFYLIDKNIIAYKSSSKVNFNSSIEKEGSLKGKGVSPFDLLSVCPKNNDKIELYGSTKFQKDIKDLLKIESSQFFSWTNNILAVLNKDSFEIVISKQNDVVDLQDLLLEMTLNLASDSLIPPSVFINNFEVFKFEDTLNWQYILPQLTEKPKYFTNHNNYIYLANSLKAIQWLAKEIQLGETYYKPDIEKKIPHNVNYLKIESNDNYFSTSTKLNNQSVISFQINKSTKSKTVKIAMNEFSHYSKLNEIFVIDSDTKNSIITLGDNQVKGYSNKGDSLWQKKINSKKNKGQIISINDKAYLVLNNGAELMMLNSKGINKTGFPYRHENSIIDFEFVKYIDGNERLFIYDGAKISLVNLKGELVNGWQYNATKSLNSNLYYSSTGGKDYIHFSTNNDSLLVLNRRGAVLYRHKLKGNSDDISSKIFGDKNLSSHRILNIKNNYLFSFYLTSGEKDSIKLNVPNGTHQNKWINFKGKHLLCLEYFDRVVLINEFGFIENEILKPEPNTVLLYNEIAFSDEVFMFLNSQTNALYLLDTYGNLKIKKALKSSVKIFYQNEMLVTYLNKKILNYHLN